MHILKPNIAIVSAEWKDIFAWHLLNQNEAKSALELSALRWFALFTKSAAVF